MIYYNIENYLRTELKYSLSLSEMKFISLFRRFRVETIWVEVRKDPDRIVSFIYIPSGKNSDFIFTTKLLKIAPVFVLYPVNKDSFVFGTTIVNSTIRSFRTVVSREELLTFINEDWDREFLKERLSQKPLLFFEKGREVFPKGYSQLRAKKLYSDLHLEAKRDAYMFDVDVALLESQETDFLALLEYKHGRNDFVTYNERVGYSFLKDLYRTLLVVGSSSFSVYDFRGHDEELIGKVTRENLEEFLAEILSEPIKKVPEVRF